MRPTRPLIAALAGLAIAAPTALAQLPELPRPELAPLKDGVKPAPLKDGVADVLPGDAVEDVVSEPLPAPVEDVVKDSPVAPVREEVRRIVNGSDGGPAPGGGGQGGTGSSTPARAQSSPQRISSAAPVAGGDAPAARERRARQRHARTRDTAGRDSGEPRNSRRATARDRAARAARERARRAKRKGDKAAAGDARNPVARTIDRIVEVVPTAIWLAIGVLLLLAAALGARSLVERRRARELERERERLRQDVVTLERALLPAVPETLGALAVSVAHRASEGPAAGGDFYDGFALADGRAAVLVGDVSGHGPEALERTNGLRTALHDRLAEGLSPRAAIESVGWDAPIESSGKFATVVVAVHDPADGTLTYAMAGHPPPIFAGPGAHEPLTATSSPPIGLGFRTGLRETTIPLPPGTVACLFTDGLLEARRGDDLIGREELAHFVAELGPDEYAESILARVVATADEVPDDMAVCVLRAVAATETRAARVETLVLDAEDVALGVPDRFLEACDVPAYQAETALEALSTAAAAAGGAVLEVTCDESGARVRVTRLEAEPAAGAGPEGAISQPAPWDTSTRR
jgi:serine phosphatase RsbU (regulator of sigma subunit)